VSQASAVLTEALKAALAEAALGSSEPPRLAWNTLVVLTLRQSLLRAAEARGWDADPLRSGRLFCAFPGFEHDGADRERERIATRIGSMLEARSRELELPADPESFAQFYESLLASQPDQAHATRKRSGSFYTPQDLTTIVVGRAFEALLRERRLEHTQRIVDPALGAGAFLLQAGRQLSASSGRALSSIVRHELFGADISPLAVAAAEAALWLLADDRSLTLEQAGLNLVVGNALLDTTHDGAAGVDWSQLFASGAPAREAHGFDLVIGNPPWVAFAGRAAQPLPPELRELYRTSYRAFSGYPTLHGLFIELAARLAPRGVVALLVPSPIADLDGYRHVRSVLARTHAVQEPLLELGQDAFANVTQPCFALIANPRQLPELQPERPYVLSERSRSAEAASALAPPPALARFSALPRLPGELFGEMGLQTTARVTRELLFRGSNPPPDYSYALLEGRDVSEFRQRKAQLFLKPDRHLLSATGCRLREPAVYTQVKLVVRQTAAIPIAALHQGTPFRNSLLAGFELPDYPAELLVGLLNSTLYRALHLAARRDARQTTFPQVKIAHLRALPAPYRRSAALSEVSRLARQATLEGLTLELRQALDAAVFSEFEIEPPEASSICEFVRQRSPRAGLVTELSQH
jgi:hypothetical protein